ncbi:hypothetical protein IWW45_009369, partial [Coemansia sp. RSA 485]
TSQITSVEAAKTNRVVNIPLQRSFNRNNNILVARRNARSRIEEGKKMMQLAPDVDFDEDTHDIEPDFGQ